MIAIPRQARRTYKRVNRAIPLVLLTGATMVGVGGYVTADPVNSSLISAPIVAGGEPYETSGSFFHR